MDRSRRATNPDAFNADGMYRPGARIAVRSRRYRGLAATKADPERRLAAERRHAQGGLANRVLAQANVIKVEKVSYRSLQKSFGRSVQRRAPTPFVSTVKRKAASAGAEVVEFQARTQGNHRHQPAPVDAWHDVIGDPTLADAILDRLVHNAHRLELEGESLRKRAGRRPPLDLEPRA